MTDLFYIVVDLPIDELHTDPCTCPYCRSEDVVEKGSSCMTLLGANNHHWDPYRCRACDREFTREYKDGGFGMAPNVWYVEKGEKGTIPKVLRGMPSCFESYTYTCAKCAGTVVRRYANLDNDDSPSILSTTLKGGTQEKHYRTFYECRECGHGGQVEDDHWSN